MNTEELQLQPFALMKELVLLHFLHFIFLVLDVLFLVFLMIHHNVHNLFLIHFGTKNILLIQPDWLVNVNVKCKCMLILSNGTITKESCN